MNDTTKPTEDPALAALRERAKHLQAQIDGMDLSRRVAEAQLAEINVAIEIVARNGRRKPGPKPGGAPKPDAPALNLEDAA